MALVYDITHMRIELMKRDIDYSYLIDIADDDIPEIYRAYTDQEPVYCSISKSGSLISQQDSDFENLSEIEKVRDEIEEKKEKNTLMNSKALVLDKEYLKTLFVSYVMPKNGIEIKIRFPSGKSLIGVFNVDSSLRYVHYLALTSDEMYNEKSLLKDYEIRYIEKVLNETQSLRDIGITKRSILDIVFVE